MTKYMAVYMAKLSFYIQGNYSAMTSNTNSLVKYRKDYQPSQYLINKTELDFELNPDHVLVNATLHISLNPDSPLTELKPLTLNGVELELLEIKLDDTPLSEQDYRVEQEQLVIYKVSNQFSITTQVKIYPNKNTSLEGLYLSNGKFCTQCEAEGFRKITYYLDRPDIMSEFFVSIEADKSHFPTLLSNGNLTKTENLDNGRHRCHWHDPFLKPSYLFALVAGEYDCLQDSFTTMSGREIKLQLFVEKGKLDQCDFAMQSLINSMKWDEQEFGREYDLDLYMIVAVSDFNMGAMENKGLNVFNTAYVLAKKETATDSDFEGVERVIAHEYFHNWTGNRITCRDWFQLSLKEGLTVFRDQKFSEDMQSAAVERIDQVKIIRAAQFVEDSGPMAHPIRPDSYIEMNNFYTVTVYNKGAEVIRMMHTLLGKQGFRAGMDLYFERHDGQAVTCEDFIKAMEDANQVDWTQFRNWYSQAGTPEVTVSTIQSEDHTLTLEFKQSCPPTPGQTDKKPFMIPIKLGFIDATGKAIEFSRSPDHPHCDQQLIVLTQSSEQFTFEFKQGVDTQQLIPSLLRDFSAPVKLHYPYSQQALAMLFAHDPNSFNRWDAGQLLMANLLMSPEDEISLGDLESVGRAFVNLLADNQLDPSLKALAVQLPNLNSLIGDAANINLDRLFIKYRQLENHLANELEDKWQQTYDLYTSVKDKQSGDRWLANTALSYLLKADESKYAETAYNQQLKADNMTDEVAALQVLCRTLQPLKQKSIGSFYQKWKQEELVLDKWFSAQVQLDDQSVLSDIESLFAHNKFSITNPNKVRALFGAFVGANTMQFHASTGAGYELLGSLVKKLNKVNPQIGARMAKQFGSWKKFDVRRQAIIKEQLESILTIPDLSKDIYEVVNKSLQD